VYNLPEREKIIYSREFFFLQSLCFKIARVNFFLALAFFRL
jgi:hypothetical protein